MTMPIEEISVCCPHCKEIYEDWYRGSINLELDDFNEDYIEQASSSTCPKCQHKVYHSSLIIGKDGTWHL